MTTHGLQLAQEKMRRAGVAENAITVFSHYYGKLAEGATGVVPE